MSTIIAYQMPVVLTVITTLPGVGAEMQFGTHQNRPDFTIYRGVENNIELLVKNIDRKPVVFATGEIPYITISQSDSKLAVLRAPLSVVDATKGWWRFTLTATQASLLSLGQYRHVLTVVSPTAERMLFTDQNYAPTGSVYCVAGPAAPPRSPIIVPFRKLMQSDGVLRGGPWLSQDVVSISVTLDNYVGKIVIEQSDAEMAPNQNSSWTDLISTQYIQPTQGVQAFGLTTPQKWIRFRVEQLLGHFVSGSLNYS